MELPKVEVKKILYATDLSESARRAFAYAVSLANLYQAKITFLHVMSEDPNLDFKMSCLYRCRQMGGNQAQQRKRCSQHPDRQATRQRARADR